MVRKRGFGGEAPVDIVMQKNERDWKRDSRERGPIPRPASTWNDAQTHLLQIVGGRSNGSKCQRRLNALGQVRKHSRYCCSAEGIPDWLSRERDAGRGEGGPQTEHDGGAVRDAYAVRGESQQPRDAHQGLSG